jgi:hypothetical protein
VVTGLSRSLRRPAIVKFLHLSYLTKSLPFSSNVIPLPRMRYRSPPPSAHGSKVVMETSRKARSSRATRAEVSGEAPAATKTANCPMTKAATAGGSHGRMFYTPWGQSIAAAARSVHDGWEAVLRDLFIIPRLDLSMLRGSSRVSVPSPARITSPVSDIVVSPSSRPFVILRILGSAKR